MPRSPGPGRRPTGTAPRHGTGANDAQPRDEKAKARTRALRFLQTRERSRLEVADRLRRYGYDATLVAELTAWLEDIGLLDEGRFARAMARARLNAGWSRRRILTELAGKGVTPQKAEDSLAAATEAAATDAGMSDDDDRENDEDPEDAILLALVRRRFGRQSADDPEGAQRRAIAFLVRRGHGWDRARRLVARAAAGERGDREDR
jgi:Uncharacterized protein conserved in bacteria